jgi:hypothetical protein
MTTFLPGLIFVSCVRLPDVVDTQNMLSAWRPLFTNFTLTGTGMAAGLNDIAPGTTAETALRFGTYSMANIGYARLFW